jgi:AAA ATPase domain
MSWLKYHTQSEQYVSRAEQLSKSAEEFLATELYGLAAKAEVDALNCLNSSQARTIGITAVSAVSLYFKAQDFSTAKIVAEKWLSIDYTPSFAVKELQDLLQEISKVDDRKYLPVQLPDNFKLLHRVNFDRNINISDDLLFDNPKFNGDDFFSILRRIFTGRDREIKSILNQLRGTNRKRVLVYGNIGIGKTALILSVLDVLQRKIPNILTCYISLPMNTDLGTAALIALAREMPNDDWAQEALNQMGLKPSRPPEKTGTTFKGGPGWASAERRSETIPIQKPQIPDLSFEDLLNKALETVDRVIIAIDDLDKQDPARVKDLLLNAQGLLKGRASFILTGHPSGLTEEILLSQRGLFDLSQELLSLDFDTTKLMLLNYLNSVRPADNQIKDITAPNAFHPFTPAAADLLCTKSAGVPRVLNRFGTYILDEATQQNASSIDEKLAQEGIDRAKREFRDQANLSPREVILLDTISSQGLISDASLSFEELQQLQTRSFAELLPILEELERRDLIQKIPNDGTTTYKVSPLLPGASDTIDPA